MQFSSVDASIQIPVGKVSILVRVGLVRVHVSVVCVVLAVAGCCGVVSVAVAMTAISGPMMRSLCVVRFPSFMWGDGVVVCGCVNEVWWCVPGLWGLL